MESLLPTSPAVCDFCSAVPVVKSFAAALLGIQFTESVLHVLDSRWAACAVCARLIEEDRWDELTDHAIEAWRASAESTGVRIDSDHLKDLRREIARLHRGFREARAKVVVP